MLIESNEVSWFAICGLIHSIPCEPVFTNHEEALLIRLVKK